MPRIAMAAPATGEDASSTRVDDLIQRGRSQGHLSLSDLRTAFEQAGLTPGEARSILRELSEAGVRLADEQAELKAAPRTRAKAAPRAAKAPAAKAPAADAAAKRYYLCPRETPVNPGGPVEAILGTVRRDDVERRRACARIQKEGGVSCRGSQTPLRPAQARWGQALWLTRLLHRALTT